MSLGVPGNVKDNESFTTALHTEVTCENTSDVCYVTPDLAKKDGNENAVTGDNVFNEIEANTLSMGPTMVGEVSDQKYLQQNIVTIDANSLVDYSTNPGILNNIEIINNNINAANENNVQQQPNNGTIYLLVSQSETQTVLQPIDQQQFPIQQQPNTSAPQMLNIVNLDQNAPPPNSTDNIKNMSLQNESSSTSTSAPEAAIVQVMNTEGVPVNINVNDIIATLNKNNLVKKDGNTIINLASFVAPNTLDNAGDMKATEGHYVLNTNSDLLNTIPNWALQLRDCTLCGDTYTGYVFTESEMDDILNLYKKETQSLFAIRQTPSAAKDESAETVRLMWKSQYIPYDGIPFVNVGRRATVMECEHGPRKRSNALKRMAAMSGQKSKKIPNLTCPARLFVKKVKKFPQYRVPPDSDPKVVRGMQEHALKMVRSHGVTSGEIRLYMQLPLPSAHRYHHIGNSLEIFQKELANLDNVLLESISVDTRVLEQLQTYVRQGYNNPFQVRAGLKDFVQNHMVGGLNETSPSKHDKTFYPSLIEIQNMIQQTEAAIETGVLSKLPTPDEPPVALRPKRKRTKTVESPGSSSSPNNNINNSSSTTSSSSLMIKRMKIDVPSNHNPDDLLTDDLKKELKTDGTLVLDDQNDTIALTLTDNQLENFSVTNFSYDQLAQLAKIGLAALNNASKEPDGSSPQQETIDFSQQQIMDNTDQVEVHLADKDDPNSLSTTDGESILIVTPSDVNDDKTHLRIIATSENADQPTTTDPSAILANVVDIVDGT